MTRPECNRAPYCPQLDTARPKYTLNALLLDTDPILRLPCMGISVRHFDIDKLKPKLYTVRVQYLVQHRQRDADVLGDWTSVQESRGNSDWTPLPWNLEYSFNRPKRRWPTDGVLASFREQSVLVRFWHFAFLRFWFSHRSNTEASSDDSPTVMIVPDPSELHTPTGRT